MNTMNVSNNNRYNMSSIFRMAWRFIKSNGYTLSEALKCAWANAKLKRAMKGGIVRFTFRKISGEVREAWGTLKESLLPPTTNNRPYNATLQTYYDTEKADWRCYKVANLLSVG